MKESAVRHTISLMIVGGCALLILKLSSPGAAEADKRVDQKKPVGIEKRVPWTTSKVKGSPEPPAPYRAQAAFPKLKFAEPLAMAAAPGSNRLFIAERHGKI